MKMNEWKKLKAQGYKIDKAKTPFNEKRFHNDFKLSFNNPFKNTVCYMCEFGDFNGKQHLCSQGHGPFNSLIEMPNRICIDKEYDDYYYDMNRLVIRSD